MKSFSKAQREAAVATARTHDKVQAALEGDGKVLFVEPNLTGRGKEHPGQAVVGLHDYKRNRSMLAVVDPEKNAVVGVEELRGQLQLSEDERREANTLAGRDARVREFLGERDLDPLTRLYFPPDAKRSHRYAIVFARPDTSERRYVVVDLTAKKVVDVLDDLATRGPHGG